MADTPAVQINLDEIKGEIAKLSKEQLQDTLLKARVRQKVQQKKHQGSAKQKEYQAKQREKIRLMKEQALKTPATAPGFANMWEQINAAADEQAEEKLAEESTAEEVEA